MEGRGKRLRLGVLVSGGGTNLQAIIDRSEAGLLSAEVVVVISDRPEAYALERARRHGIPTVVVRRKDFASDEEFDEAIMAHLRAYEVDLVVLAGYLKILTPRFVEAYRNRIINIHPALLPSPFGGKGMYGHRVHEAVLAHGCKVSGCTVHFVDEGIDAGPIILQRTVPVLEDDTPETLAARVLQQEHQALPEAIQLFAEGRLVVEGRRVRILTPEEAERRRPTMRRVERALISVSEKTGLVEFAQGLQALGIEILSTGGTAQALREAGVPVVDISAYTGFPELFEGRVKTLHPKVHGGILFRREEEAHRRQAEEQGILPIDLVAVTLYPFEAAVQREGISLEEAIEQVDIGGVALLRAAAKNYRDVVVVSSPHQYEEVLTALREHDRWVPEALRSRLALEAFRLTARYDAAIARYLAAQWEPQEPLPRRLELALERVHILRYGENPHQSAALYLEEGAPRRGLMGALQLQGKELSFNNLLDAEAAWNLVLEFDTPAAAVIKHTNPCGVALGKTPAEAFQRAWEGDPMAGYGGIVAFNRPVDEEAAERMRPHFLEVVVAPGFAPEALEVLQRKKNLRLLTMEHAAAPQDTGWDLRRLGSGFLVQERDWAPEEEKEWRVVTVRQPTPEEWADLRFAWKVVKHVKSNAIVLAKGLQAVGIGAGQMSRVDAAELAVRKAGRRAQGAVMASDAFLPFRDNVDAVASAGVTAIIQPGGSIRDEECIQAADEHGLAMVFTGRRHFRH